MEILPVWLSFSFWSLTKDSKKNVAVSDMKMLPHAAKIVTHGLFDFCLCDLFSPFHCCSGSLDQQLERVTEVISPRIICWGEYDLDVACFYFLSLGSTWVSLLSLLICFYSSFLSSLVKSFRLSLGRLPIMLFSFVNFIIRVNAAFCTWLRQPGCLISTFSVYVKLNLYSCFVIRDFCKCKLSVCFPWGFFCLISCCWSFML